MDAEELVEQINDFLPLLPENIKQELLDNNDKTNPCDSADNKVGRQLPFSASSTLDFPLLLLLLHPPIVPMFILVIKSALVLELPLVIYRFLLQSTTFVRFSINFLLFAGSICVWKVIKKISINVSIMKRNLALIEIIYVL